MAQLININSTEFRRCNLSAIQSGTWASLVPDENEIILISTTNSLTADGSGECDAYIKGDGTTLASALELKYIDDPIKSEVENLVGGDFNSDFGWETTGHGTLNANGAVVNSSLTAHDLMKIEIADGEYSAITTFWGHPAGTAESSAMRMCAFYNASNTLLGVASLSPQWNAAASETTTQEIPAGTTIIYVYNRPSVCASPSVTLSKSTQGIVPILQEKVEKIEDAIDIDDTLELDAASVLRAYIANVVLYPVGSTWNVYQYDIEGITSVHLRVTETGGVNLYTFLNAQLEQVSTNTNISSNVISYERFDHGSSVVPHDVYLNVPEGAKYLAITVKDDYINTLHVSVDGSIAIGDAVKQIYPKTKELEQSISDFDDRTIVDSVELKAKSVLHGYYSGIAFVPVSASWKFIQYNIEGITNIHLKATASGNVNLYAFLTQDVEQSTGTQNISSITIEKMAVSLGNNTEVYDVDIIVPSGAKIFAVTLRDEYADGRQVLANNAPISIAFDFLSKSVEELSNDVDLLKANTDGIDYSQLTWNAVGDSITHQQTYMQVVQNIIGLPYTNKGVSGCTIAKRSNTTDSIVERVCGLNGNTAMSDSNVWTIMGGLNDCLYSTSLGSLQPIGSTYDITTIYGALQTTIEYILGLRADQQLLIVTPTQSTRDGWSAASYPTTMKDVRDAIINVAKFYSVPVIDAGAECGISLYNCQRSTNPTTSDGVHLSALGATLLGRFFAKGIKNLMFGTNIS